MKKSLVFFTFILFLTYSFSQELRKNSSSIFISGDFTENMNILSGKVQKREAGRFNKISKPEGKPGQVKNNLPPGIRYKPEGLSQKGLLKNVPSNFSLVSRQKNSELEDKARIVLKTGNVWYDGSGYQMLLDSDHNAYGTVILPNEIFCEGDDDGSIYANFAYKIPENAEGILSTGNIILEGEDFVDIPEGIYDFCIVNPSLVDGKIYIAYGKYGAYDDYFFEAGYTYNFEVTYDNSSGYYHDIVLHIPATDISLQEIILPANSPYLTDKEIVKINILNNGFKDIAGFDAYYQVNEGEIVKETFTGNIEPGEELVYEFNEKVDFSRIDVYEVKAWLELVGDSDLDNNELTVVCKNAPAFDVPYYETFASQEDTKDFWTVLDNNGDGTTWYYSEFYGNADGSSTGGCMVYMYDDYNNGDDYLISYPVSLKAGTHHLAFYSFKGSNFEESMQVLLGNTSNPAEMTILEDFPDISHTEWTLNILHFEIQEDGDYYFAFHAVSKADQYVFGIDNILIGEGEFTGLPDIELVEIILPLSGCDISSQSVVQAKLRNKGTAGVEGFTVSYQVNNLEKVIQTSDQVINIGETITVAFEEKADFSVPGLYEVTVDVEWENQPEDDSKVIKGVVKNFSPVSLPFNSDFTQNEKNEYWQPDKHDAWIWDKGWGGYYAASSFSYLLSACLPLQEGNYKVRITYLAGAEYAGNILEHNFTLLYGKTGSDILSWEVIKNFEEVYTNEIFEHDDILFEIKEDGEYGFAILNTIGALLIVSEINIENVPEHDIWIKNIYGSCPHTIPAYHIEQDILLEAEVYNNGFFDEELEVIFSRDGTRFASTGAISIPANRTAAIETSGTLSSVNPGTEIIFSAEAVLAGNKDEFPENNMAEVIIHASDSTFIADNTIDFSDGIGNNFPISFGTVFTLNKADYITSITLGLGRISEDIEIGLGIYPLEDITNCLISGKFERSKGGELKTFVLDPVLLEAGTYYFEVQQLGNEHVSIATDNDPRGYLFVRSNNELLPAITYGYLCMRPNFGLNPSVNVKNENNLGNNIEFYYDSAGQKIYLNSGDILINRIKIFNLLGVNIDNIFAAPDNHQYIIPTYKYEKGLHFLYLETYKGIKTFKFIVE